MLSTMYELRVHSLNDKSFGFAMFAFDPFASLYIHEDGKNGK